ncbi:MAG: alpha-ketoglutarate-dependent taurine dioxygenase [Bacteroidia bacterium]|jgi:alpha-ketoglutarate-dependent taurine dioxygenase
MNYILEESQDVKIGFLKESQLLPLVIMPKNALCLISWAARNKDKINELITEYGGILFRGFDVESSQKFEAFIESVSSDALEYKERSSPRKTVSGNIYTSTDHPREEEIFLHNEHSYSLNFPSRIFFYCESPSLVGGNTPIADTRKIYERIPQELREVFSERQYRYSRCLWPMMGMTWQQSFQTHDKMKVENYCRENSIGFEWIDNNALKTYQIRPLIATHPISKQKCWFNHCTFFNISSLSADTQNLIRSSFDEQYYPNNTYYGDGEVIADKDMAILRDAYNAEKSEFEWQKNDILMLDNVLTAHGRCSFEGARKIYTGMSQPWKWDHLLA